MAWQTAAKIHLLISQVDRNVRCGDRSPTSHTAFMA